MKKFGLSRVISWGLRGIANVTAVDLCEQDQVKRRSNLSQQRNENRVKTKTVDNSCRAGPSPSSKNKGAIGRMFRGITPAGRFNNARMIMCKNFTDLMEQVIQPCNEVSTNVLGLPNLKETSHYDKLKEFQALLQKCQDKATDIMPILERDKMKAVVFGCTSSGKSSLINAMLEDDVLPTSMGVCSSCLVHIEGCDSDSSFLQLPDGSRGSVQDLEELGSELGDTHLGAGETAVVFWPKAKCKLLNNDIQIVDRPGISSNPDIDRVVNDKCSDADVHIFVVDSVASITTESREYFISVAKKLSKPNIFFVFNKWDESAHTKDPEKNQKVQQQHVNAAKKLLKESLIQEREKEFETNRVFFVSAREIIWAKTNAAPLLKGHQDRRGEFNRFLEELQKSISARAIKTKFGPHCNEGLVICNRLDALAQRFLDCLDHARNELIERHGQLIKENNQLRTKREGFGCACAVMTEEAKTRLTRRVTQKKEELGSKIESILKEIPFEEDKMGAYKQAILKKFRANDDELHRSIEKAVTDDLADVRRGMEDFIADIGDVIDFKRTQNTNRARFTLRKPPTTLSDVAAKDIHIDPPSLTDNMAWYRRGMSSVTTKYVAFASSAIGVGAGWALASTGVGAGVLIIGGGAIGIAKYLESNRETRRKQILEAIMRNYKIWSDEQEHIANDTYLTELGELANNIKSTFIEKINTKLDSNEYVISSIDTSIQQLKLASERLKMYKKSPLQNVKNSFEKFQWDYLQDDNDSDTDMHNDRNFM